MVSKLCNWRQEKEDEIMNDGDCSSKGMIKAFCIGALDGLINVVFMFGVLWYIGAIISTIFKRRSFMDSKY